MVSDGANLATTNGTIAANTFTAISAGCTQIKTYIGEPLLNPNRRCSQQELNTNPKNKRL
jgi:hypothetical protein